jgi:hypothetical protein
MTEAAFPLLGAAFVVLVVLPACALLAKAGLLFVEREDVEGPLHGLGVRYVLLTASSLLPLAWFLSAGLHQAESGKSVLACLLDHDAAALCLEPVLFAVTLTVIVLGLGTASLRSSHRPRSLHDSQAQALLGRVDRILALHPVLRALRGRIAVTAEPGFDLGAHGLLKPVVFVGTAFAARVTDDMLASALGHESEHLRSLDPLRFRVLRLALAVNPFGAGLLDAHAKRWYAAQEAHCDREAVLRGSAPLPLAEAIVRAARPSAREAVALGARDTAVLKFRIGMLLAFAEQRPARCCHQGHSVFPVGLVLLAVTLLLPHQAGTAALDALHTGAEHALTYFWR